MSHRVPKWTAAMLTAVWWLTLPLAEAAFYVEESRRGAYPPDADSIGIPIGQNVIGWLILSPLVIAVAALALRGAPPRVRWLAFDRTRPLRAGAWTLLLGALAGGELWTAVQGAATSHWADVANGALGVAAALALRAAGCETREQQPAEPYARTVSAG